jgi:hypothetical protein
MAKKNSAQKEVVGEELSLDEVEAVLSEEEAELEEEVEELQEAELEEEAPKAKFKLPGSDKKEGKKAILAVVHFDKLDKKLSETLQIGPNRGKGYLSETGKFYPIGYKSKHFHISSPWGNVVMLHCAKCGVLNAATEAIKGICHKCGHDVTQSL